MKITVCHPLLLPLILLFCCQCLTAEHGKVNDDNWHSIYKTNTHFNAKRSDMKVNKETSEDRFLPTNSSRADIPCPASAAIAPCTCSVDSINRVYLNCTFVESVDQLVEVFQQSFPVKELYQFIMTNNSAINWFPSFMNGITFESIYLGPGPFILADITDHFLFDLKDTLKEFVIFQSKLTTDFFPFFMLPAMNQLEDLRIYFSDINWIPQIAAPKLTRFALEFSPIELLVSGTFPIGTGPMTIWVNSNQIHTIEVGSIFFADQSSADSNELISIDVNNNQLQCLRAGTFPLRNGPMYIYLYGNQISSIEPGTFVLPASTGADSNELLYIAVQNNQLQSLMAGTFPLRNGPMYIYLYYNQISSIEPGTFVLPASTDLLNIYLLLDYNELTTVDEAVFGNLMPFITDLRLYGNPLTCGCDMAWLILNEGFLATVDGDATCADGTNLHALDHQQYIDFC